MHELSIAISMVDEIARITEEARARGSFVVRTVRLSLGALSGVDKEALRFCYKAVCEDTFLAGSELAVEVMPVVVRCAACRIDTHPASIQQLACSRCSAAGQVVQGHELEVAALEVEG